MRCDMCRAWRMENGKRITACMEACPAHALSLVLADGSLWCRPPRRKRSPPLKAMPKSPPPRWQNPAPALL